MLILFIKIIISALIVSLVLAVIVAGIIFLSLAVVCGIQLAASDFFIDGLKYIKTGFKKK